MDNRKNEQEKASKQLELARLRVEHSDYHAAIEAMMDKGCDRLQIQRMKKKKMTIKEQILKIEDGVTPDIIA